MQLEKQSTLLCFLIILFEFQNYKYFDLEIKHGKQTRKAFREPVNTGTLEKGTPEAFHSPWMEC